MFFKLQIQSKNYNHCLKQLIISIKILLTKIFIPQNKFRSCVGRRAAGGVQVSLHSTLRFSAETKINEFQVLLSVQQNVFLRYNERKRLSLVSISYTYFHHNSTLFELTGFRSL